MIKRISEFETRYVVNRLVTPTSPIMMKLKKTCDNCYEKHALCDMSNGIQVCKACSEDIEALTNRLPSKN